MVVEGEGRLFELQLKLDEVKRSGAMLFDEVIAEHADVSQEVRACEATKIILCKRTQLVPGRFMNGIEALNTKRFPLLKAPLDEVDLDREWNIERELAGKRATRSC